MPYNQGNTKNQNNSKDVAFRPKIGKVRESGTGNASITFLAEMKTLMNSGRFLGSRIGRGIIKKPSRYFNQRVVIKSRVVRHKSCSTEASWEHVNYLMRDGVGLDGDSPEAFDNEHELEIFDLNEWVKKTTEDRHHFRFIVSPDNANELDLKQFTRDFVKQVEADLKTRLEWFAVPHYNTDNPHIHLILRGVDETQADLVIKRDYISKGLRITAEELATRELGIRSELDIKRETEASISKARSTYLDKCLLETAALRSDGLIDLRNAPVPATEYSVQHQANKLSRLRYLESLGLAQELEIGIWRMDENLYSKLKELSIKNDIIKRMHKGMYGVKSEEFEAGDLILFNKDNPPVLELKGKVLYKGLVDELYDTKFIIVKGQDGKNYQLSLTGFTEFKARETEAGCEIKIVVKDRDVSTKSDLNIVEFTKHTNGIYDPARHEKYVKENVKLPSNISPSDYVSNHRKRITALIRMGLVEELELGGFRVPEDLIERLKQQRINYLSITTLEHQQDMGMGH